MKNQRAGLLSAKLRRKIKCPSIYNNSFESSPNKNPKVKKYKNLSLTINNNNKEKSSGITSPFNKNVSSKFIRSLSNNNIYPSLNKKNIQSMSTKNIYSEMNNNNSSKFSSFSRALTQRGMVKSPSMITNKKYNRYFKIEDEKLSQEIYYLTRDINKKNKKLYLLGTENRKKDRILTEKENEINYIINKNRFNTNEDEVDYDLQKYFKFMNIKSNIDTNNTKFNYDIIFNNRELNNSNYNNLFTRIKYQILKSFKEIKKVDDEIKQNKKLKIYTKMKELNFESNLLQSQIKQLNTLINNSISIYNKNQEEIKELQKLENSVSLQYTIIAKLNKDYNEMVIEEYNLNRRIKKMENIIEKKNIKKFQNSKLINTLTNKRQNLSKEKIFQELYNKKENKNYINKLKKLINIYKFNYKVSSDKISVLKEELNNINNKKNKNKSHYINKNNIITNYFLSKDTSILRNLDNLYQILESKRNYENLLKSELFKMKQKFDQLDKNNNINIYNSNKKKNYYENDEEANEVINFGITEDNPYFSGDEDNIPENTNKFNNYQFGNFAYILFKNFESRNILLNESQTKIINPLINAIDKKNVKTIKYKNESFNFIVNELTKIIMNLLENTNEKNRKLISIFIGALLHNSNYDVSKLIYYLNVLFSYTKNYFQYEELFIYKFQTKYKEQLTLLYNKLYEYIKLNNKNPETNVYIPLLKMKEIIEANNIQLKEKYLEFLYYYMKKFSNPESNLEDLDFDLLNNLFSAEVKNNEIVSTTSNMNNNSVTEITNEEYEKHLKESLDFIKLGVKNSRVTFDEFVKDITYLTEVDGKEYKYFTIENFNEELRKCNIDLSELQLSCLCNKYSIPDNLKYIDKNKIEKDINIK